MRIASLFIVIALALNWLPHAHARELVKPPFVRHWTCFTDEYPSVIAVRDGVVYYRSDTGVGTVTLATGQRRWTAMAEQAESSDLEAQLVGKILFVLVSKTQTIHAITTETGKARVLARVSHSVEKLGADASNLYVLSDSSQLTALSQATGKVLWSHQLAKSVRRASLQLAVTSGGIYVGVDGAGEFGVDPKMGKTLWNRRCKYPTLYTPQVLGSDVVTHFDDLRRTNVRTGRVIWKASASTVGEESGRIVGDVVIGSTKEAIIGHAASDGRVPGN